MIAGRICVSTELQGIPVGASSRGKAEGDLQSVLSGEIQPAEGSLPALVFTVTKLYPPHYV